MNVLSNVRMKPSYCPSSMKVAPPGAYFQRTATQLKRLEKASTGPLFSLYGETFRGVTSIRAFDRRAAFEATLGRINPAAVLTIKTSGSTNDED